MPQNKKNPVNGKKTQTKNKNGTDWGKETLHGVKIVGFVTGKVITYILNALMTLLLIGLITGTVVGIAFIVYINNYIDVDMSNFEALAESQNMTTKLYYMDYEDRSNRVGTPVEIEDQQLFSNENRMWVSYDEMPTHLVEAFISIEDERFWTHDGVDWKRTLGAAYTMFTGSDHYGGSTITQQLIKNITQENDVTVQRKVKEIISALELEKTINSKEKIIEMYLNTIYLSEHCYGVQAAATAYFGKDVSELTLVECAALASIPKFPTKYDPYLNPEENDKRRDTVLMKMHELEKITDTEYQEALDAELVINEKIQQASQSATTSWYTDAVIEDAIDLLMQKYGWSEQIATQKVYTGGYHIYTVMDPFVQNTLDEYFRNPDNFAKINNGVQPEASMVIIDPDTGDILGIAGGRGEKTKSRVLNYATQTTRSPGSSIKPVAVYGPALESGLITYSTVYKDSYFKKKWPVNYPATYEGNITINEAVRESKNTVAVKVLNDLGLENSYKFVHDQLGMHSVIYERTTASGEIITDLNLSALALGGMNYGVTVRELTSAYQVFANKGIYSGNRTIVKILDNEGNVIIDNSGSDSIVMSEQNASIMTRLLQNVVTSGTASKMKLDAKVNVAGKTGTTSSDNDRWFVGYSPYYLGGVWFGYSMPMALTGFSETAPPSLMIWDDVMAILHQPIFDSVNAGNEKLEKFELADGIVSCTVCKRSGLLMTKQCTGNGETGYFTKSTVPKKYCTYHEDENDDSSVTSTKKPTTSTADTTKPVSDSTTKDTTTIPIIIDDPVDTPVDSTTSEPPQSTNPPVVDSTDNTSNEDKPDDTTITIG